MTFPPASKITVTGDLGSGKSATSRLLCERTGFDYVSTGRIQRQLAQELNLDTLEMNRRADVDPTIDQRIDGIFIDLGKDPNPYVVDSRLAWFFLPSSYKVYLQTPPDIAAQRIIKDSTRHSERYENPEEAIQKILARKQSENERFLKKYGADSANLHNFDIVIDTTRRKPDQVADLILKGMQALLAGLPFPRFL
jgi:cytidylate kinase